ncbi:MAG: glycosyltransferase family 4 protein [Lentisphaerae bacterium]|nr:glycosyltransferase family 4 protein [Lentisphaerota bacterium]
MTRPAGVGRYTRQLVRHLAPQAGADTLTLSYFDFKRRGLPFPVEGADTRDVRWMPGRAAQGLWKYAGFPSYHRFAGPADVYHFPNFILPPLKRGRTAVTIHDLAFLRHPDSVENRNLRYLRTHIGDTVRRADAVITVSRFTADEVIALLGVPHDRVFPIHHGIAADFTAPPPARTRAVLEALNIDRPYLLSVGTIEPRKNYPFLIDVFEALTDFDGLLVIAGGDGWKTGPILERIRRSPRAAAIRRLRYVEDEALPALYAGARLLLQTSFYEGFGFPPLEAMACGTPVLSSAGGSLSEVLGDSARILAAFDAAAWAGAARALLRDDAERAGRIEAGRRHAASFRWENTACRTWEVYRAL